MATPHITPPNYTPLYSFFYDSQVKRFLAQFIRIMSGFQVQYNTSTLQRVPVFYGDGSRQAFTVLNNNSEATMISAPAISCIITGMAYDRSRMQVPTYVEKVNIRQRAYNEITNEYENRQGKAFTIERLMPVPYTMEVRADILTSNAEQKHQLFEQISVLFNPALEIQSTDNYLDWGSLSVVYLDSQTWTNRSVPMGSSTDTNDIMSLNFKMPIWINPPAKIKKLGVIQKIISSIHDVDGNLDNAILNETNLM